MHSFFRIYWISLNMFRTVFPSIIRSSRLYTQQQIYVIQVSWLLVSGPEFHLLPASKQSTNLYDIYLMLYVQPWAPDDGRKDRPKHVEWYSLNSKIVHLVGFTIEIPLPDNTQHAQQTDTHVPGGIRKHNLSKQAAADLCLRPRGHWDRHTEYYWS